MLTIDGLSDISWHLQLHLVFIGDRSINAIGRYGNREKLDSIFTCYLYFLLMVRAFTLAFWIRMSIYS